MIEKIERKKLREKRKHVIERLRIHGVLGEIDEMSEDQMEIYNQIQNFDFSYWEDFKIKQGWTNTPKTPSELIQNEILSNKRATVRSYLRRRGHLPPYCEEMNDDEKLINDQISQNDFSFYDDIKVQEEKSKQELGQFVFKRTETKKIYSPDKRSELPGFKPSALPKTVFFHLRMVQVLPKLGENFTPEQQAIVDDVNENWLGKTKNYFIKKYLHLTTPEGRLLYRLHKSHTDYGFNFNLTVEDIVIPTHCPYLEIELSANPEDKDEPNYYTGDRIDSSKGYVKGNLQVISMKANRMKNKSTELELLKFSVNGLKLLSDVEQ